MTVRTRFAPSPTGYLHIGGVRTALFNWLFARQHGGQFILRIDDTDQQRNVAEALQPILDGFQWLGLDWDEGPTDDGKDSRGPHGPYFQSQRSEKYQAAVGVLLEKGLAYRDFARPEEVQAEREAAEKEKRPFVYSRRWMADSDAEAKSFESDGRQAVVRLKMPRDGACEFCDHVRGDVSVQWSSEQDHVIQRADGSFIYHLASVVDDHDFQITHVIRAAEHLSNTPRQIFIAQGLGYDLPEYAHLPVVNEPGGNAKLSKRKLDKYLKNPEFKKLVDHGQSIARRMAMEINPDLFNPVVVDFYRDVGYLPDAIINYILLLGWSLDDKTEDFTRDAMIEHFSLGRVNKAPASFDPAKLFAFQDRHMQRLDLKKKTAMCVPFLQRAGWLADPPPCDTAPKVTRILEGASDRVKVAGDILDYPEFFVADDQLKYDEKAIKKRVQQPGTPTLLRMFKNNFFTGQEITTEALRRAIPRTIDRLFIAAGLKSPIATLGENVFISHLDAIQRNTHSAVSESFDTDVIEGNVHRFAAIHNIKPNDIIHAIRVAITGRMKGIGLYDTMSIIGSRSCEKRIDHLLGSIDKDPVDRFAERESDFPVGASLIYADDGANKPFRLFTGDLTLQTEGIDEQCEGFVEFQWLPSPTIKFEMLSKQWRNIQLNRAKVALTVDGVEVVSPSFVVRISAGTTADSSVTAIPEGRLIINRQGSKIQKAVFHVANFHDAYGDAITSFDRNITYAGRTSFHNEDWQITLDGLSDARERISESANARGFAFTHVASVTRVDGGEIRTDDLATLLFQLQLFFSFCRGFWVAPMLPVGLDRANNIVWREWVIRNVDGWTQVRSWYPILRKDALNALFTGFCARWNSELHRRLLQTAVYWYVDANVKISSIESSVLSSCIGLEALAYAVDSQQSENASSERFPAKLHKALHMAKIPRGIPESLSHLQQWAASEQLEGGPDAIWRLRNLVVHPISELEFPSSARQQFSEIKWEAARLALWYFELLMLFWCDFRGDYHNRLPQSSLLTAKERVPWD